MQTTPLSSGEKWVPPTSPPPGHTETNEMNNHTDSLWEEAAITVTERENFYYVEVRKLDPVVRICSNDPSAVSLRSNVSDIPLLVSHNILVECNSIWHPPFFTLTFV